MNKWAYKELTKAKRLDSRIKRMMLHLEELETILLPNAIRYDVEKVQHEPVNNLEEIVMEIIDIKRQIVELQAEMIVETSRLRDRIERIDNEGQKDVMTCRYIRCLTQEKTAERIGYTKRQVQNLEYAGKDAFQRILKRE